MVYVQQHQFEISCLLKHKSIIIMGKAGAFCTRCFAEFARLARGRDGQQIEKIGSRDNNGDLGLLG